MPTKKVVIGIGKLSRTIVVSMATISYNQINFLNLRQPRQQTKLYKTCF